MTAALPRPAPPRDCAFDPDDWAVLARHWYPVALSAEVGDTPTAVRLLDETLVSYRVSGNVVVAHDICPYRGVALSLGDGDGSGITCARHGLRFDDGGRCVHVPAHPESGIPSRLNLRTCPPRRNRMFAPVARDFDTDQPVQAVYDVNRTAFEDDRAIVEVHKPENLLPPGPASAMQSTHTLDVIVHALSPASATSRSYEHRAVDGALPALRRRRSIDVRLGPSLVRQYSLCDSPRESGRYLIRVRREEAGRGGSRALHRGIAVGRRLRIPPPRSHFPLVTAQRHVLVAGGIGIAPAVAGRSAGRAGCHVRPAPLHLQHGEVPAAGAPQTTRSPSAAPAPAPRTPPRPLTSVSGRPGPARRDVRAVPHPCSSRPL